MQVLAWKTPDGKLFEDETKYKKHLKKCEKRQHLQNLLQHIEQNNTFFNDRLRRCQYLGEIADVIIAHWPNLCLNAVAHRPFIKTLDQIKSSIKFCNVTCNNEETAYLSMVANTHACPEGGVRNWFRHPNKPMEYPGIIARMSIVMQDGEDLMPDCFNGTLIKTGTGGGHESEYAYDIYLFQDDFPNLKLWKV